MKRRHVTDRELHTLSARGLSSREFWREVSVIEHGEDGERLLELRGRRDAMAKLYRDALNAALLRTRDGSLQEYQLRALAQAFAQWRSAVRALIEFQSGRR